MYEKDDQSLVFDCTYLKSVNTKFPFYVDQDHDLLPETCAYPFRFDEPKETKIDPIDSVHSLTPSTVPDRYKPLILPPIFHAFVK